MKNFATEPLAPARVIGRNLDAIDVSIYGDGVDNKEPVYTFRAMVGVATRADLDEDTVYAITKAFWESVKKERESTPWLAGITPELGVQDGGLALHPGALRYYKEIGLEIPEGSMAAAN